MSQLKLIHNGKLLNEDALLISPNNRSFRYGDGFFETIKVCNQQISLANEHMERLFASLDVLQFSQPKTFTPQYFKDQILQLVQKNKHTQLARVRLTFFRGNGGLYDAENHHPNYIIQSWELNSATNQFNENGLVIDVFSEAKKICDNYSHVKSNNYLCYAMAALWAKKNKLNDALLLNPYNHIADATIANVWIVNDGIIKTAALTEGCVSGVMRKYLLKNIRAQAMPVQETTITVDDVLQAQEVFLTNAIYGIKWVQQCGKSNYQNNVAALLHQKFVQPLFV